MISDDMAEQMKEVDQTSQELVNISSANEKALYDLMRLWHRKSESWLTIRKSPCRVLMMDTIHVVGTLQSKQNEIIENSVSENEELAESIQSENAEFRNP